MRRKLLNATGVVAFACFIAVIVDSLAHHREMCLVCGGRLRLQCNVQLDQGNAGSEVQKLACSECGNLEFRAIRVTRTASGAHTRLNPPLRHPATRSQSFLVGVTE
jgi:hypothetical protein